MDSNPEVRHERECPWCAERILVKARLCRFCNREVPPVAPEAPLASSAHSERTPQFDSGAMVPPVFAPPAQIAPPGASPAVGHTHVEHTHLEPEPPQPVATKPESPPAPPPAGYEQPTAAVASASDQTRIKSGRLHMGAVPLSDLEGVAGWLAWFTL